jgi:hypothetical protein
MTDSDKNQQAEVAQYPIEGADSEDLANLLAKDEWIDLVQIRGGACLRVNKRSIYKMGASGMTAIEICDMLGVSKNSFYKHFAEAHDLGKASVKPTLKALLLKRAQTSDKVLMFCAKNYLGMSEQPTPETATEAGVEWIVKAPSKPKTKGLTNDEMDELSQSGDL